MDTILAKLSQLDLVFLVSYLRLSTVVHWVCENKSGLCGRLVYQLHDFLELTQKKLYKRPQQNNVYVQ